MENVKLTRIKVENFKSLKDVDVKFSDINVLVGENASGKSNFLEAIVFLRDLFAGGLENAFLKAPAKDYLYLCHSINKSILFVLEFSNNLVYEIQITFVRTNGKDFKPVIAKEALYYNDSNKKIITKENNNVQFENCKNINIPHSQLPIIRELSFASTPWSIEYNEKKDQKIKELEFLNSLFSTGIITFNPDTDSIKNYHSTTSRTFYYNYRLADKCSHIGEFLDHIELETEIDQSKTSLINYYDSLVEAYLPGIDSVRSVCLEDGTYTIKVKEKNIENYLYARSLSDGTLKMICYIALLVTPDEYLPKIILLEEPDNGLHPKRQRYLADILKELSKKTQVIVTTHSVDFVNFIKDPESIITVTKTPDGTKINNLNKEELDVWLEEYQLGELWMMGELGENI